MTFAMADMCEPTPYTANLLEATRSRLPTMFIAARPVASPVESMRLERNRTMHAFLNESLEQSAIQPSESSKENFSALLSLLPSQFPVTDPYVSQCGSIVLDWDFDPQYQLSIMLKDRDQIAFAAYLSGERVHGSTAFAASVLPDALGLIARKWARRVGV